MGRAVRSTTTASRGNRCRIDRSAATYSSTRRGRPSRTTPSDLLVCFPSNLPLTITQLASLCTSPLRVSPAAPKQNAWALPLASPRPHSICTLPPYHRASVPPLQRHGCTQGPTLFSHLHTFLTAPLPTIQPLTTDLHTVAQRNHNPAPEINWTSDMSIALNRILQVMPHPSVPPPYLPTVASRSNHDRLLNSNTHRCSGGDLFSCHVFCIRCIPKSRLLQL